MAGITSATVRTPMVLRSVRPVTQTPPTTSPQRHLRRSGPLRRRLLLRHLRHG